MRIEAWNGWCVFTSCAALLYVFSEPYDGASYIYTFFFLFIVFFSFKWLIDVSLIHCLAFSKWIFYCKINLYTKIRKNEKKNNFFYQF